MSNTSSKCKKMKKEPTRFLIIRMAKGQHHAYIKKQRALCARLETFNVIPLDNSFYNLFHT
jgi:hypothetical protein